MADLLVKLGKKKKKRELRAREGDRKPLETQRFSDSEEESIETARPWRNLNLIRSIESIEIDLQKKVKLAYENINSRLKENTDEDNETSQLSRLIVSLNDWVQPILISAGKKIQVNGSDKPLFEAVEACLDYRC